MESNNGCELKKDIQRWPQYHQYFFKYNEQSRKVYPKICQESKHSGSFFKDSLTQEVGWIWGILSNIRDAVQSI